MPWWETLQWNSQRYLPVLTLQLRGPHWQHFKKPITYTADDQPSNAQHSIACTVTLHHVPPYPTMPSQECDSSDKYSEECDTSYHLAEFLGQFQWFGTNISPLEPASHPHIWRSVAAACRRTMMPYCGIPAMSKSLAQRRPHTQRYARKYLQCPATGFPTFDGQDSLKLEDCFMYIETTTDISTRSHTHLMEAKTCGLTCTFIQGSLQAGKSWETKISNNSNLLDKATSTVALQCYTKVNPFLHYYSRHFQLLPHYENQPPMMRNISLLLTSQPKNQYITTFQQ